MRSPDFLTVSQAAAQLGVPVDFVRQALRLRVVEMRPYTRTGHGLDPEQLDRLAAWLKAQKDGGVK